VREVSAAADVTAGAEAAGAFLRDVRAALAAG